ncbi:DUF4136 domain-containing protein [Ferrimonas aestuarii]|uniref:DUF4136 domain-containing protein n=1 Tax=Ferrimonas aestuarii TaxID=2569539 RepID=A0A4U1BFE8_9GAMM|nr:DUF4136 domain-containing protein [Ferrimonas aestuarii]TKB49643.1 DUF4136 domain-containing protein [Ferrimonas aestuarii]
MKIIKFGATAVIAVALLLGCGAKPQVDFDQSYDFDAIEYVSIPEPKHDNHPLMAKRAQTALTATLASIGWRAQAESDIELVARLWQQKQAKQSQFSIGIGGGSYSSNSSIGGGVSIPVGSDEVTAQYLRLDLFDSGAQRWQAQTFFAIDGLAPEELQQQMDQAVQTLLQQLPITKAP